MATRKNTETATAPETEQAVTPSPEVTEAPEPETSDEAPEPLPARHVMITRISGTRDGVDWPAPGEPIALPDDEAEAMLAAGHIRPITDNTTTTPTADGDEPRRGRGSAAAALAAGEDKE